MAVLLQSMSWAQSKKLMFEVPVVEKKYLLILSCCHWNISWISSQRYQHLVLVWGWAVAGSGQKGHPLQQLGGCRKNRRALISSNMGDISTQTFSRMLHTKQRLSTLIVFVRFKLVCKWWWMPLEPNPSPRKDRPTVCHNWGGGRLECNVSIKGYTLADQSNAKNQQRRMQTKLYLFFLLSSVISTC